MNENFFFIIIISVAILDEIKTANKIICSDNQRLNVIINIQLKR